MNKDALHRKMRLCYKQQSMVGRIGQERLRSFIHQHVLFDVWSWSGVCPRTRWSNAVRRSVLCILFSFLIACFMAPSASAWSAEYSYGPTNAYQSTPFTFHVTVTNTGSEPLYVIEIALTIYWPDWPFDEPEPTERHVIFSGEQVIEPGDTQTFEKKITSNFFGGFSAGINVTARASIEDVSTTQTIAMGMSFAAESQNPSDDLCLIVFVILIIVGSALFVIYSRGPWGYDDIGTRLSQEDAMEVLASVPSMAKLYHDEVVLRYWAARFKELPTTQENQNDKISGLLVATNQRLIFFELSQQYFANTQTPYPMSGPIPTQYAEVHLEEIKGMRVTESARGTSTLEIGLVLKGSEATFRFSNMHDLDLHTLSLKGPTNANKLEVELRELVDERVRRVEAGKLNEGAQLTDFSTLREQMMRMGVVLKTIRCPSCGGDVEPPLSGVSAICKYCGSKILAQQFLKQKPG